MNDLTEILQNENTKGRQGCMHGGNKKKFVFLASIVLLIIIIIMIIGLLKGVIIPQHKYNRALSLLADKDYMESYKLFKSLGDYKNAESIIKNFRFLPKQIREYRFEEEINAEDYVYDASNNSLKVIESYSRSYSVPIIEEYLFDDDGNCIKKYQYFPNKEEVTRTYKYDDRGNLIEEELIGGYTIEYIYDSKNNCIRELRYSTESESVYITEYTYNEKGKCIKEEEILGGGERDLIVEYFYDDRGNCIKESRPVYGGVVSINEFVYDEKGNCIKDTHTYLEVDGSVSENITECFLVYDENGNCIEKNDLSSGLNPSTSKRKYIYDENGNCIKSISEYGFTEYKDYFVIYSRQELDCFWYLR